MKAIEYLIDKNGVLIYPLDVQKSNIDTQSTAPSNAQVTLTFYDDIETTQDGVIIPKFPVFFGLSGTVTMQARSTDDNLFSNIQNGILDLSLGQNMCFPSGVIRSLIAICDNVSGCNYIRIRLDRGV